ncbi:uncharacterized protein LOC131011887 [Salvia miltiorrhiza]|uniref:uncharacterized protein LOC131011887 n=1 Tax=Salvia miltiorrhiza TaxID=226208 RepID=UPI0025AC9AB4|nr:uncharacterized protein LOC131011887 [Salvia miltiorrhiza]
MKECRDERRWCCFHPREMVVGICALCLNERLLVVVAESKQQNKRSFGAKRVLPKIFALITRSDIKHHKSSSPTPEESFISIKFEENGVASWDKGKISSHNEMSSKSVIEHTKPGGSLRWRRRVGHLIHLIKRKRSVETEKKVKYGWIRILTKRKE